MCTAVSFTVEDHYFGRTLDHTCSYGEEVVVAPRRFPFRLRHEAAMDEHYAMVGAAYVADGCPLYYDAVNEKGLAMAGLNFVGYAGYGKPRPGCSNIAQFEMLPWILGQCASVSEARALIGHLNVVDTAFSAALPPSQLHWMIADHTGAIVIEAQPGGISVHDDPAGVMTNNPEFGWHMQNLSNYMHLSPRTPENGFGDVPLKIFSNGLGAVGLPGDMSSPSRFVRAAFLRHNSVCESDETSAVSQFFHIMAAVEQPRGACIAQDGGYMSTVYTSCCNTDRGIYYFKTYDGHAVRGVDMFREDLSGTELIKYPLRTDGIIIMN